MLLALFLFILTYVLMLCLPKHKHYVAFFSAIVFIILGILPLNKLLGEIDFNYLIYRSKRLIKMINKNLY